MNYYNANINHVKKQNIASPSRPPLHDPPNHSSPQSYWSGFPFLSPGALYGPGIEPAPVSLAVAGVFFTTEPPGKPLWLCRHML